MPDHERIAIVTDSTADLPPDLARERGITVVPLTLRFGHEILRDRVDLSTTDLVQRMDSTGTIPAISSPSSRVFESVFRELAPDHDRIIAVLVSSRLSATVKSATIAARKVRDVIPVDVVDSLNASFGLGLQVLRAADLVAQGIAPDKLVSQLQSEVALNHVVFFVETLEHLRRIGHVGKASEMLGSFLQLKPVLRIDEGQVIPFERARTRAKALDALVDFVQSIPAVDEIAVVYDTTPEDVDAIMPRLEKVVGAPRIRRVQFGPVLAANIGPGVVGIAIREKPVA